MCADCHSTNVSKNFDVDSNSYNTQFSEINIACESCHSGASEHLLWLDNKKIVNIGFNRDLSTTVKSWQVNSDSNTLAPQKTAPSQQVLTCAQCHSRRSQISTKDHVASNPFGERYLLDLIISTNYHADGQVYNENFVYGSFLQSKMYQKGIVCSNCHAPHSAKLKLPVATLCLQCHQPDTCLSCHEDQDSNWSLAKINTWFPTTEQRQVKKQAKDFAAIFSAASLSLSSQQWQSVSAELSRITQTLTYAPIIRAAALTRMSPISNENTITAFVKALKNDSEYIRLGAILALQGSGSQTMQKWRLLLPLLTDKVLAVRSAAAFTQAYINLSQVYRQLRQSQQTIKVLQQGSKANPDDAQIPFELAMAYIRAKDKATAATYLSTATKLAPQNSHYFYVLGLALEQQNKIQAYKAISQAMFR